MKKLFVPLMTAFDEDENVNYGETAKLAASLLKEGADGIYAIGSSSECYHLSEDERIELLKAVVDAAEGASVIAHVGCIGTRRTIALAERAAKAGATGLSSVPPFYFHYTFASVKQFYWDLADATGLPLMIYYYPYNTGLSLSADEIAEIINGRKNIDSIKFTDGDFYLMEQVRQRTPGKHIMSGKDQCFLSALAVGADGAIGTTQNFALGHFRKIAEYAEKGDLARAAAVQGKLNNIIAACGSNIFGAGKAILDHKGFCMGNGRRPFLPLSNEGRRRMIEIYEQNLI